MRITHTVSQFLDINIDPVDGLIDYIELRR